VTAESSWRIGGRTRKTSPFIQTPLGRRPGQGWTVLYRITYRRQRRRAVRRRPGTARWRKGCKASAGEQLAVRRAAEAPAPKPNGPASRHSAEDPRSRHAAIDDQHPPVDAMPLDAARLQGGGEGIGDDVSGCSTWCAGSAACSSNPIVHVRLARRRRRMLPDADSGADHAGLRMRPGADSGGWRAASLAGLIALARVGLGVNGRGTTGAEQGLARSRPTSGRRPPVTSPASRRLSARTVRVAQGQARGHPMRSPVQGASVRLGMPGD
jgi:hypothetical protein